MCSLLHRVSAVVVYHLNCSITGYSCKQRYELLFSWSGAKCSDIFEVIFIIHTVSRIDLYYIRLVEDHTIKKYHNLNILSWVMQNQQGWLFLHTTPNGTWRGYVDLIKIMMYGIPFCKAFVAGNIPRLP